MLHSSNCLSGFKGAFKDASAANSVMQFCDLIVFVCFVFKKKNTFTHHFTKSCGVKTQSGISDTCLVTLEEVRMREKLVAHLRCLPRWYKIMCCSEFECML